MSLAVHQLVTIAPNANAGIPVVVFAEKFSYRLSRLTIVAANVGVSQITVRVDFFDASGALCFCTFAPFLAPSGGGMRVVFSTTPANPALAGSQAVAGGVLTIGDFPPDLLIVEGMSFQIVFEGALPPGSGGPVVTSIVATRFIEQTDGN